MKYQLPRPLEEGDVIGLVTPSSPLFEGRLEAGIKYFETLGFRVKVGKHNKKSDRFLAGTDAERADDIMSFLSDPKVNALVATGGGYGSQRILPLLDYNTITKNPKMLIGFSDTTALILGLLKKSGMISFTGFTCGDISEGKVNSVVESTLINNLFGKSYEIEEGSTVNPGAASGPLIAGSASLITSLMGTPYQPDFKDAILLIEEVWAEPYIIDGMISQLALAGVFEQVSGVIFGVFEKCEAKHFPERDGTVHDVINDWCERIRVPCIRTFPYGHIDRRCVLPVGQIVELDATRCRLIINYEI